MNDYKVECIVWGMSDGKITELRLGDFTYSLKELSDCADVSLPISPKKDKKKDKSPRYCSNRPRHINTPLLFQWIKEKNIKKFTLKKFMVDNPTYTGRMSLLRHYVSRLIKEKKIIQVSSNVDNPYKDEFKVVGDV